jgi:hypothetical protein
LMFIKSLIAGIASSGKLGGTIITGIFYALYFPFLISLILTIYNDLKIRKEIKK